MILSSLLLPLELPPEELLVSVEDLDVVSVVVVLDVEELPEDDPPAPLPYPELDPELDSDMVSVLVSLVVPPDPVVVSVVVVVVVVVVPVLDPEDVSLIVVVLFVLFFEFGASTMVFEASIEGFFRPVIALKS